MRRNGWWWWWGVSGNAKDCGRVLEQLELVEGGTSEGHQKRSELQQQSVRKVTRVTSFT